MPPEVSELCYVTRSTLVGWLGAGQGGISAEGFAERVKGCLVKVAAPKDDQATQTAAAGQQPGAEAAAAAAEGGGQGGSGRAYYVGLVINVFDLRKMYAVEGMRATKGLVVKDVLQGTSKTVKLRMLSSSELSDAELGHYLLATTKDQVASLVILEGREGGQPLAIGGAIPCDLRREGGQSLAVGGPSLVTLEGREGNPL